MKFSHHHGVIKERKKWPLYVLVFLIIAGGGFGLAAYNIQNWYKQNVKPLSATNATPIIFSVESGSSIQTIGDNLQSKAIIKSSKAFVWYVRTHDLRDQLKAGTYRLNASMSVADIVKILVDGKVASDLFTVLPGRRIDQIKEDMKKAGFKDSDIEEAFNPALYANHPALTDKPVDASLEGYLYPESFAKTKDTLPSTIVKASLDEMQKRLTPAVRLGITKQGLTVHEGVILASIINQEVSKAEDRKIVAQIFLKRIKQGMPLESDATIVYGAAILGKNISLDLNSPYNSYINKGLPPGPISNVSESSLAAVVAPASTDYLYFVAGDNGENHYSSSLSEHQDQVRQFCKKLCQ